MENATQELVYCERCEAEITELNWKEHGRLNNEDIICDDCFHYLEGRQS